MIVRMVGHGLNYECLVKRSSPNERMKRSGPNGFPTTAEGHLLYNVAKVLNARGYDLIKKDPQKDGNLTALDRYLVTRKKPKAGAPHIYIYNKNYALWDAGEEFNKGAEVSLSVALDIYSRQGLEQCWRLIEVCENKVTNA